MDKIFDNIGGNHFKLNGKEPAPTPQAIKPKIKESDASDALTSTVSNSTISGKAWNKMIYAMDTMLSELKDFDSQFSTYQPLPNTKHGILKMNEIMKLCNEIKPIVIGMDKIEKEDFYR